jgi:acetyltransferase-like isoleucine patch superfamily enzyme
MSQSLTEEFQPILTANYTGKRGVHFFLFCELWITITGMFFLNKLYYVFMFANPWMLIFLPISIYGLFWQFFGITTLLSTIVYKILAKIEPPKEGEFSLESREYHFYSIRFWVCYYLIYFARAMPLPWVDMFIFPIFGSKIGSNVVLYDSWIDPEFVEIGGSCMLSLNTQIFSHGIFQGKFIVKKVVIEKNCIAGAGAIVSPGTFMEEGSVLGVNCSTKINQRLAGYLIHVGSPVSHTFPIKLQEKQIKTKKGDDHNE